MNNTQTPEEIYANRLIEIDHQLIKTKKLDSLFTYMRLVVFLIFTLTILGYLNHSDFSLWYCLTPLVIFLILCFYHQPIKKTKDHCTHLIDFFKMRLKRINNKWIGTGDTGDQFKEKDHLYCDDLDLFGVGSLFEYLNTTRSDCGQEILARWMKTKATIEQVENRQQAIKELTFDLPFKENLVTLEKINTENLLNWTKQRKVLKSNRLFAIFLGSLTSLCLILWFTNHLSAAPFLLFLCWQTIYYMPKKRTINTILDPLEHEIKTIIGLEKLSSSILETRFNSAHLTHLQQILREQHCQEALIKLKKLIGHCENFRRNQILVPITILFMLSIHLTLSLISWRQKYTQYFDQWLSILGEFETLTCLACFSFENQDYCWPQVKENKPFLDIKHISHPLLPKESRVANDVTLDNTTHVMIISGSNMSGKSTLLRSIGVGYVLAFMGAPLSATSFSISNLNLASSIQLRDNLMEGHSRFYTEILRLKSIIDLAQKKQTLFLLDEILSGTNSDDRFQGARIILTQLNQHNAIGCITTHDLKVTSLADQSSFKATNYHFTDDCDSHQLKFNYQLCSGIVPSGNAIKVMKYAGIDTSC